MNMRLSTLGLMIAITMLCTACSKGGELTLEPGARVVRNKGIPFATVNLGGKAVIVEQGQTVDTGISGWATIQGMSSTNTTSADGTQVYFNKTN